MNVAETVKKIRQAYGELTGLLNQSLEKAKVIGDWLTEIKPSVGHGNWIPWIKKNLPFGEDQASRFREIAKPDNWKKLVKALKKHPTLNATNAKAFLNGTTPAEVKAAAKARGEAKARVQAREFEQSKEAAAQAAEAPAKAAWWNEGEEPVVLPLAAAAPAPVLSDDVIERVAKEHGVAGTVANIRAMVAALALIGQVA